MGLSVDETTEVALLLSGDGNVNDDVPLIVEIVTEGNDNVETDIFITLVFFLEWGKFFFVIVFYEQAVEIKHVSDISTEQKIINNV